MKASEEGRFYVEPKLEALQSRAQLGDGRSVGGETSRALRRGASTRD